MALDRLTPTDRQHLAAVTFPCLNWAVVQHLYKSLHNEPPRVLWGLFGLSNDGNFLVG